MAAREHEYSGRIPANFVHLEAVLGADRRRGNIENTMGFQQIFDRLDAFWRRAKHARTLKFLRISNQLLRILEHLGSRSAARKRWIFLGREKHSRAIISRHPGGVTPKKELR